jgi:hypothetical protein
VTLLTRKYHPSDLYEFHSTFRATENYVLPDGGSYEAVLSAMWELGQFEDIVQTGSEPALGSASRVAIVFSTTSDVWMGWQCDEFFWPQSQTFHSNKRALYIALKHLQYSVDILLEPDDLADQDLLSSYATIYLADAHITAGSASALSLWVQRGGTVFASAGAGARDEFDRSNLVMQQLLGVETTTMDAPANASISFIKADLPYTLPLDTVVIRDDTHTASFPAFGAVASLTVPTNMTSEVDILATFLNRGDPAVSFRRFGRGAAIATAFMPGLSYFAPAIPAQPLDRCSRKECFTRKCITVTVVCVCAHALS